MNKYNYGKDLIDRILKLPEIGDNDEGIISVDELCNLMNNHFKEYLTYFYKPNDSFFRVFDEAGIPYSYLDSNAHYGGNYSTHSDFDIDIDTGHKKYYFYQEYDSDKFYFSQSQFNYNEISKQLPIISPVISDMFRVMKQCYPYKDYLTTELLCSPTDHVLEYFGYYDFSGNIKFNSDGCFYSLSFSNISEFYQKAAWEDSRTPLKVLLNNAQGGIIKRIPIDVNELSDDNLLKIVYFDSKSLDNPVNHKIR